MRLVLKCIEGPKNFRIVRRLVDSSKSSDFKYFNEYQTHHFCSVHNYTPKEKGNEEVKLTSDVHKFTTDLPIN